MHTNYQELISDPQKPQRNKKRKCRRCGKVFIPMNYINRRGISTRQYCYDYECEKAREKEVLEQKRKQAREYKRKKKAGQSSRT